MEIEYGPGVAEDGPGVSITLSGEEVALAIHAWLVARDVIIRGPSSITVNGQRCERGHIDVDPSGQVIAAGERFSGCGPGKTA